MFCKGQRARTSPGMLTAKPLTPPEPPPECPRTGRPLFAEHGPRPGAVLRPVDRHYWFRQPTMTDQPIQRNPVACIASGRIWESAFIGTERRAGVRRARRASRGVSLVDAILASVLLATAVVAISTALVAGAQQTYEAVDGRRGTELAESLMEEILSLPYSDPGGASLPGPEAGEPTRASFDNVDDYHGYSESAGAVVDRSGNPYPAEYSRFARFVTAVSTNLQPRNKVQGRRIVPRPGVPDHGWRTGRG